MGSAQQGHRVGSRVRDPRPVRVLFVHQQGPGASKAGGVDQCVVGVAGYTTVSAYRARPDAFGVDGRAILLETVLVQVEIYPPEDSQVDLPEHRQANLAVRPPEYIQ